MREKLIGLIASASYEPVKGALRTIGSKFDSSFIGAIADWLIKYGVVIPVRCKNCKYRSFDIDKFDAIPYCRRRKHGGYCADNDFCSYGERKDNE